MSEQDGCTCVLRQRRHRQAWTASCCRPQLPVTQRLSPMPPRPQPGAHFEYVCVGQVVGAEAYEVDHGGQLAVVLRAHLGGLEGAGGADVLGGVTCATRAAGWKSTRCEPGEPAAANQRV